MPFSTDKHDATETHMNTQSKSVIGTGAKDYSGEGIYCVVRYPEGWELVINRFERGEDINHAEWFKNTVAGMVATKWAPVLQRSPTDIEAHIKKLSHAFPRGRIIRRAAEDDFLFCHGDDLPPSMQVEYWMIPDAFDIDGLHWRTVDLSQRCWMSHKDAMRGYLGINEDWRAV